jgi:hypothetical protein
MRRFACAILVAVAGLGCRQTTEPPRQVTVTLASNRSVSVRGDTITFTVNATGNKLVGVVIDYGDSGTDQYATSGALTARVTFKHAYDVAGNHTVRAIVTDAFGGEREATTSVVVN